ncbi:MAG: shikimate kinase [Deltaproteobacteria bacterium]|nr:shikimate kinase [Deltaproteobacteria bacterium]
MSPIDEKASFLKGLGARVRQLRRRQGVTLKELAGASGVSERYLSSLEGGKGNISVGRLADVARALRVSVRELIPEPGEAGGRQIVSLLGLRGAGKSSVGQALADRMGVPFRELDALVEAEAGLSLAEIFEFHGEDYYRRLEYDALDRFLREGGSAVIATGGGIVTAPEAYALLLRETTTVWLQARPEDHWHRVVDQGDERPMADNPHAMAELRTLLDQRTPLYARAQLTIPTQERSVDEVVAKVEAQLD